MSHGRRIRPFGRAWVPAATGSEAAAFDRHAIEELGVPQATLMENAGRAAATLVQRLHPDGEVVGLVGGGNNGGDALVALRALAEWGRPVRAILVTDRPPPERLLHGWPLERRPDVDLGEDGWSALGRAGVVLDGILGTGLRGAPRERQARAIARVNAAGRPVVSLDIPSGVQADDGTVPGEAVRADLTVAFGPPKLGSLFHPGRTHAGRLVAVDIGFPPVPEGRLCARLITPGWASTLHPARKPDTHKKAVGVVLVLAGREGMAGAAVLATRAALRAGAGLVRVASVGANREVLQATAPAAVFVDVDDGNGLADALGDTTAVLAGPGLGTDDQAERALARLLEGDLPLLLDADALNLAAQGRTPPLAQLAARRPVLLTPHAGEMRRIAGAGSMGAGGERVAAARRWADDNGCVLLLKGSPSIVASPGRAVLIDILSSADLATGGLGDVLAGAAASFMAQGLPPRTAAALALWTSGRAAMASPRRGPGLLPEDVVEGLPRALRERGEGEGELPFPFVRLDLDAVGPGRPR